MATGFRRVLVVLSAVVALACTKKDAANDSAAGSYVEAGVDDVVIVRQ